MTTDPKILEETLYQASLRDQQTVDGKGQPLRRLPHGATLKDLIVHTDERGEVMEMMDLRWQWHSDPIVFCYYFTVRPGWAKGWGMHLKHEDRYCLLRGKCKLVLYDARADSPTHGLLTELFFSDKRSQLINIPAGVWHADENVGDGELLVVNYPTIPYDHADPDKYRLPLDTDLIPYKFASSVRGG